MDSWTPIIFIVLAIAMAVGPVLMLKPSPRQQGLAKLRSRALELGLRVHMLPLSSEKPSVPAYCKPWLDERRDTKPWVLELTNFEHDLNFSGAWAWQKDLVARPGWHQAIKEQLEHVPKGVLAIANGPQGLCCFWAETGGEVVLDQIHKMLQELNAVIV